MLIEIDDAFNILTAVGAAKAVLGKDNDKIKGGSVLDVCTPADRPLLSRKLQDAKTQKRIDPIILQLTQEKGEPLIVNLGVCLAPSRPDVMNLTITVLSPSITSISAPRDPATGLLNEADFLKLSAGLGGAGLREKPELMLVRLDGLTAAGRQLSADRREQLLQEISAALRAQSIGGHAATRLSEISFGLLPSRPSSKTESALEHDLMQVAEAAGLDPEVLQTKILSVDLETGTLDETGVRKGLAFITQAFSKPDVQITPSLEKQLKAAMKTTVNEYAKVRSLIDTGAFKLYYQPVAELKTGDFHHYEALLRSDDGRNPFEIVTFSENLGLIQDLDMAICRKALEAVAAHPSALIAINLSGYSVQSEVFCEALRQLIAPYQSASHRILFELTETGLIDNIEQVAAFFKRLRRLGFSICLDDFGAGAASYHYLRNFEVDFVKIDGGFFKAAKDDKRQRALVRSINALCLELGSAVIAEQIENDAYLSLARELGIGYGQGYLFGRPDVAIKPRVLPTPAIRRTGVTESWQ